MRLKLLFLLSFTLFTLNFTDAQTRGTISGQVIDAQKNPADAATILLVAAKDSSVVKTMLAGQTGSFLFDNIKDGDYKIWVTSIGFKNYKSTSLSISPQHSSVVLPPIILMADGKQLNEVAVTAQKSYVEEKIDRTVVNVNALISNNGANALEALAKTPGVMVDQDGVITYKGKTGVMILIDDKPTYLSAANLTTYLRSLPASSLDQIELMDNPPAKYDAEGNAGVINIKIKKNNLRGFNASVSATVGNGFYFGRNVESINMNYRVNKINLFANISQNYSRTFRRLEIDRNFYDVNGNQTGTFKDFSYFRPSSYNTNVKTGIDYYLSQNTTWGIVLTGNYSPSHDNSPVNSFIYNNAGVLDSLVNTNNSSHNVFKSGGINLNYSHKFGKSGSLLTFDADYIKDVSGSDQTFVNNTLLPDGTLTSSQTLVENTPSYINIYAAKSDLSIPLKKKGKFSAGVKSSYVSTDNAANYFDLLGGALVPDYNNTNRFLYKENVNAAYANYNQSFGRISVQAGLRVENTNGDGHQLGNLLQKDSAFMRHYTNLFPTGYFSYKLDTAGHNVVTVSYGRRIGRPGYGNLNPFIFFIDKFSRFQGNPLLNPQFTDNYKVAYSYKSLFTVALVYSNTNGFQTETIQQQGDIFISTQGNIGTRQNVDLSVNTNLSPFKWWTMNLYAEVFRSSFSGPLYNTELNSSGNTFNSNMNNQFILGKGWSAELSGNYRTSVVNAQFHVVPSGQLNAGLQKRILKNKGSLRLSANDIFHTFVSSGNIYYTNGSVSPFRNFLDTRVTTLGFTYAFGKTFNDHQKRETGSADTEQGRAH